VTSTDAPPAGREPALRTFAMPADANPNGDIFGGWLMAQMDLAGAVVAVRRSRGRVATVAVEAMAFHRPVNIGDLVSCYAEVTRVGRSSMRVEIESWVERRISGAVEKVTVGTFTYVAIDKDGRPRPVDGPAA
jgi:acyl-CoA thioesterase YciA